MENITDHLSGIDFILKAVRSHWKALSSEGSAVPCILGLLWLWRMIRSRG